MKHGVSWIKVLNRVFKEHSLLIKANKISSLIATEDLTELTNSSGLQAQTLQQSPMSIEQPAGNEDGGTPATEIHLATAAVSFD
jgi:cytochrome oxidase assembly protein ShyY1